MKVVLREDESGISEVIGTILILAMTVVLFSTIIVWVSSIPTPVAQTRLDIQSVMDPIYNGFGVEIGVNITLTHQGGEALDPTPTLIYVTSQRGTNPAQTDIQRLHPYDRLLAAPSGLLDGTDSSWNVGERWAYKNFTLRSSDAITVTIVDTSKSLVLWTSQLNPPAGTRPPVFVDKWADGIYATTAIDPVQSSQGFYLFAQVADPDNDLNPKSVYATLTAWYGSGSGCAAPLQMRDDGVFPDRVAGDQIFSLGGNACMSPPFPLLSWAGSIILFNATDLKGHTTNTRMILDVIQGPNAGGSNSGNGTGRPPNLRWNGNQGYNIFNATQWDQLGYSAKETRTFKGGETVVLVVGSLTLENTFGIDTFNLFDPFSGAPAAGVVYGASKSVSAVSIPSSTQAFSFFQFVNGYYVYTYRFKLNDPASVGTNFYLAPPSYPRYYYFAKYPLSMLLTSSSNHRFTTTDTINITSDAGQLRSFPVITTFKNSAFTTQAASFKSTDVVYVQVQMFTVDTNGSGISQFVVFGNVVIQDFGGGTQLWRAPLSGYQANLPVCPPMGSCVTGSGTNYAIYSASPNVNIHVYRFSINLARLNQDPWVPGAQNYALMVTSIKDSDESYSNVAAQIVVQAPLYKMDALVGTAESASNAWGSYNYAYYLQDFNGFDWWKPQRVDYCTAGVSQSGLQGTGVNCPKSANPVLVAFGDINGDGTLDVAEALTTGAGSAMEIFRWGVDANGNTVYLPIYNALASLGNLPEACTALAMGDVTGVGAPSVVCGGSDGRVWYWRNDGSWTLVYVDPTANGHQINGLAIGDFNGDGAKDIAVAGSGGWVRWYPNLDGKGNFQSGVVTQNLVAVSEQQVTGNATLGTYLNTYPSAGSYETLQEAIVTIPLQTGGTTNAPLDTSASPWVFLGVSPNPGTGSWQSSGGNPAGYAQLNAACTANSVVRGYWTQAFNVSGSPPFTPASLKFDWTLSAFGATGGGSVTFYAFVDTTSGAPVPGQSVWTSGALSGTSGWQTVTVPAAAVSARITAAGQYWVKLAMYVTYGSSCTLTTGGFDNSMLTWSSTPGTASGLEWYYKIQTLPTRPNTNFFFIAKGQATASSDYDNYTFAYATNVVGGDPTTGTYTSIPSPTPTPITSTNTTINQGLPASLSGLTVWVRITDTNRVVGKTVLDSVNLDQLYVSAQTSSGPTGIALTMPTNPGSAINSIDTQDYNKDGYADLLLGNSAGNVFICTGSIGGLVAPASAVYTTTGGASVVGVRWGNITTAYPNLNMIVATASSVVFVRSSNGVVFGATLTPSNGNIGALAVGDVNGDGADDVVVGTSTGYVFFWENLGGGLTWTSAVAVFNTGAQIFTVAVGDASNAAYVGR